MGIKGSAPKATGAIRKCNVFFVITANSQLNTEKQKKREAKSSKVQNCKN